MNQVSQLRRGNKGRTNSSKAHPENENPNESLWNAKLFIFAMGIIVVLATVAALSTN